MTRPRTGSIGRNNYDKLNRIISEGKTANELSDIFQVRVHTIRSYVRRYGLKLTHQDNSGANNANWRGGSFVDSGGYMKVCVAVAGPHGYLIISAQKDGAKYGHAREHRVVMHDKLGRRLRAGEVVHHIDDDKLNNHPDNLELFASNSSHLAATLTGKPQSVTPEGLAARHEGRERYWAAWRAARS